ncbi:unnamed protein product [Cylicostephanus goldi]|uniref:DDE-1 domain-containing protein n=1 Tax=Cylicostephanus goldi TaxID=71465 RepID=A0A3P7QCH2_CYLGO|nr:unnamed protein product [Cylicostephanus goldi]
MALKINQEEIHSYIKKFSAGHRWIQEFKKSNESTFTSNKIYPDSERLACAAQELFALDALRQIFSARGHAATTHSFTVMPTIFADGQMRQKLFVEKGRNFPNRGFFQAHLEVRANTTHMMSKELLLEFIKTCIASPSSPPEAMLLVNSWTSFRDCEAILSVLPEGKRSKIKTISHGTTAQLQPLDVYFSCLLRHV